MCKGGSNTTTSVNEPPPAVMQQYQTVQNQANSAAANPYYFYPGQLVAGMSPAQTSAIGATGNLASALENPANSYGMAQPFINSASNLTAMGANTIGGTSGDLAALENPANTYGQALPFINESSGLIGAGTTPVSAADINQYMNPYLSQVGQTTMAEMNQQNLEQQQGLIGNAAASGALGGNRAGVAESALANQQNLAENAALANINAQGFNTALGAAQTTKGQQLQGGFLAGQTGQLAENAALTGLTAPIDSANSMAGTQLAAGAQMGNIGAANENASLSGLNAGLTGATSQFGMGTAEQQQQQNELNAAYGQWLGSVQYPFQNTNFLSGISTGLGSLEGGTSTTTPPKPNTWSQVMGDITGVAGIVGDFVKRGGRVERAAGGPVIGPHIGAIMAAIQNMHGAPNAGGPDEVGSSPNAAVNHASPFPAAPPPTFPNQQWQKSASKLARGGIAGIGDRAGYAGGGFVPQVAQIGNMVASGSPFDGGSMPNSEIPSVLPMAISAHFPAAPPPVVQKSNGQQAIAAVGTDIQKAKQAGLIGGYSVPSYDQGLTGASFMNSTPALYARGGIVGYAAGGDVVPTPMSEQILDYQMMGQLMPGSEVQKTRYAAPEGVYAAGGAIRPTMPESAADVRAQLRALADPHSARRVVFLAKGTPVPRDLPHGVEAAHRPEGTLLSRDRALLQRFQDAKHLTDADMARMLGYPHGKDEMGHSPHVVRARYGDGGVAYETAAHPAAVARALYLAGRHAPGAARDVVSPQQALAERAARRGYHDGGPVNSVVPASSQHPRDHAIRHGFAAGGAPAAAHAITAPAAQGMQGVSSMPLIGAQAALSAPHAGLDLPASGGNPAPLAMAHPLAIPGGVPTSAVNMQVGAPQTGGIAMPTGNAGASFAPIEMPGGASTGPITNPTGAPTGYQMAIDQTSPYFNNWSSPLAPSSGLHPNTPAPAAPAAPSQADINSMVANALAQQQATQNASQLNGFNGGHKRGGRVPKAGGGYLSPAIPAGQPLAPPPGATGTAGPQFSGAPALGAHAVPAAAPADLQAGLAPSASTALAAMRPAAPAPAAQQPANLQGGLIPHAQIQAPAPGGVDPNAWYGDFANKVVQSESGGNPNATNPRSTATGPAQFTDQTWLSQMNRDYPAFMAHNPASAALSLRSNPAFAKVVTEDYAKQNAGTLAKEGLPISYTSLDLAHRFGPGGAEWILTAPANTPATKVLSPQAIQANPSIAHMTTGQLIAQSAATMGAQTATDRIAQNGASDIGMGAPTPINAYNQIRGVAQATQQPAPQIPVPKQTYAEHLANSPWLALAEAGAAMASGTSPFFGVNFGKGLEAGIQYLKGEQGQQRARQELQANVRGRNVANTLTQRGQAIQGQQPVLQSWTDLPMPPSTYMPEFAGAGGAQGASGSAAPGYVGAANGPLLPPVLGLPAQPYAQRYSALTAMAASRTPIGREAQDELGRMQNDAQAGTMPTATGQIVPVPGAQAAQAQATTQKYYAGTVAPEIADAANAAQMTLARTDELKTAADTMFNTGISGPARAAAAKTLVDGLTSMGITPPQSLVRYAEGAEIIGKIGTQVTSDVVRQLGSREAASIFHTIQEANPNITQTPAGFDAVVGSLRAAAERAVDMGTFAAAWRKEHGSLLGVRRAFNSNPEFAPAAYASRVIPLPLPMTKNGKLDVDALRPNYTYRSPSGMAGTWDGRGFVTGE